MSIYKPCDIRGDVSELSPSLYRSWGRSLGRRLDPGAAFIVGGDVRESTPRFLAALAEGLCQSGMRVADLGTVPTPVVYFAQRMTGGTACAIVTASHSPPQVNGLKWMVGEFPPSEEEVRSLERDASSPSERCGADSLGTRQGLDIMPEYVSWLRRRWEKEHAPEGVHIVLDPGNGCWAGIVRNCLESVFPKARFSTIHDRRDGSFPDRNPDSSRPEYLTSLSAAVTARRAALGIAFDGDGDRVALVDDEGVALTAEQTTWVLLRSFGQQFRGRSFVHDVKFSDRVPESAAEFGADAIVERSGHAFIRTRMIRSRALFGCEVSGHYFYDELAGGDDGLFSACRAISFVARSGENLSQLRRKCPPVFITSDFRLRLEAEERDQALSTVASAFSHLPQSSVDGIRVEFAGGWALVRSSVTEPALTFRFEGDSKEGLDQIVDEFAGRLADIGPPLLELYRNEA